jgi:hypothetical protein
MKRLTDEELTTLLNGTESDRVERKESFKGDVPKKARQAVCAFANDLPNHNQPGPRRAFADDVQPAASDPTAAPTDPAHDPHCLAIVRHYRALVDMGRERRKPIFELSPADGAVGSHAAAVTDARQDYRRLALTLATSMGWTL